MSTVRSRKSKGVKLQNWVRDMLVQYSDERLLDGDIRRAVMGERGADVKISDPTKQHLFPFAIECKNQERINIWEAVEQANSNCGNLVPLTIIKRNRSKPLAVIDAELFISMILDRAKLD